MISLAHSKRVEMVQVCLNITLFGDQAAHSHTIEKYKSWHHVPSVNRVPQFASVTKTFPHFSAMSLPNSSGMTEIMVPVSRVKDMGMCHQQSHRKC